MLYDQHHLRVAEVPRPHEDQVLSQELTRLAQSVADNGRIEVRVFASPVPAEKVAQQAKTVIDHIQALKLGEDESFFVQDTLALLGAYAGSSRVRYSDEEAGVSYPQSKLISAERAAHWKMNQADLPNTVLRILQKEHQTKLSQTAENDAYQKKLLFNHFSEYMGPQRLRESLLPRWPERSRAEVEQAIDELEDSFYACVPQEKRTVESWSAAYSQLSPVERDEYVQQLQIEIGKFFQRLTAAWQRA